METTLTCPTCGAVHTVMIQADVWAGTVTCGCGTTWPLLSDESDKQRLREKLRAGGLSDEQIDMVLTLMANNDLTNGT